MPFPLPFRGQIYNNITECIGHTPLVRLCQLVDGAEATVVCKLENMNPLWSVKDRIGVFMIEVAEREGKLNKDTVVVEPTSGNTGIGLAFTCAVKRYRLIIAMPETFSVERRRLLRAFGVELVLTPGDKGMAVRGVPSPAYVRDRSSRFAKAFDRKLNKIASQLASIL